MTGDRRAACSVSLAELERFFQQQEQAADLGALQGEAGIELGTAAVFVGMLQLVRAPSRNFSLRTIRSSPITNDRLSSKISASLVTCLPASRCLSISSQRSSWCWRLTTAPPSTGSFISHSSPRLSPVGSGSPAIQPVRIERGATSAFSGIAGKLPSSPRMSDMKYSPVLRLEVSTAT